MKIIYEDRQILVCEKDAGEPVQSADLRAKDLVSMLKTYLRSKEPEKGEPYLAVIHRLDQPVRGILVFARTPEAAADLSAQTTDGRMEKLYLARTAASVEGRAGQEGELTDWLLKEAGTNASRVVPQGTRGAKKAVLSYRFLTDDLVRIHLLTGRHHQIRVQLSHAGMGLAGDRKYGKPGDHVDNRWRFPCLCAYHLSFLAPLSGERMTFELENVDFEPTMLEKRAKDDKMASIKR